MPGKVYIGISGWRYEPWRGHFYPKGLQQARELEYASRRFNSLEINGTFYSLQRPASFAAWARDVPEGFVFSVKAPRYITHILRLKDAAAAMGNFFASGVFALGDKMGPILWQFPPNLAWDPPLWEDFLAALPHDTGQAAAIARQRDGRMKGRELLEPQHAQPVRHAVEVRHISFAVPEFFDQLRRHKVAWVVTDTPNAWPQFEEITANFVYMRLHGASELYKSHYSAKQLERWGRAIEAWRSGGEPDDARRLTDRKPPAARSRDVFCYFDNTDKLHAPVNARELLELLQVDWSPPPIIRE